jgi:uncharacterized protein YrzB (UPF0473 family)
MNPQQKVAEIAEEHGASEVYCLEDGDETLFLILGSISDKALDELRKREEGQYVYMNPWRAKWKYSEGEVEILAPVLDEDFRQVRRKGVQLI